MEGPSATAQHGPTETGAPEHRGGEGLLAGQAGPELGKQAFWAHGLQQSKKLSIPYHSPDPLSSDVQQSRPTCP